jgi:hypothetical protein
MRLAVTAAGHVAQVCCCARIARTLFESLSDDRSQFSLLGRQTSKTTAPPRRGFLFDRRLSVGDGEAGADRQGGELNADQKKTADEIMLGPMGMMI